ncbi:MAG: hypothetical protein ACQKBV_01670 [Puniceicoccales bacterium]
MKLLLLLAVAALVPNVYAQSDTGKDGPTLPFPEIAPFNAPRAPGTYFRDDSFVIQEEMGPIEVNVLNSNLITLQTPPFDRWSLSESRDHSADFRHPLVDEVEFTLDCWPSSAWPKPSVELFQGRINALAEDLIEEGYNKFQVKAMEEDFSAKIPTRKLITADGTEVEVAKRGRTKPFMVADQYLYDLLAQKVDQNGKVIEEYLIYETLCIHPKGVNLLFQLRGDPERVNGLKPWLKNFLINSREDSEVMAMRK